MTDKSVPVRILLAKVGLDGHDRGIKVVARGLRDAGLHVIYGGIWQSPEAVAQAALDEDVDWVGLSLLSGAHMTLVPRVLEEMRARELTEVGTLVGGIIPAADIPRLEEMGVSAVFGPGSSMEAIAAQLTRRPPPARPVAELLSAAEAGNRRALSQLLSAISRGEVPPAELSRENPPRPVRMVALTGNAGVGKSSLLARLIRELRAEDLRVAVLACDPQSAATRGALLGDRIRMSDSTADPGVFIRSLAVPGGQQGIAANLDQMVAALEKFGCDVVLVESVGMGQGDVAVRNVADCVLLLVQPESGDAVQWEKAGLLEIADAIVASKSDLPGAERLASELQEHLSLSPGAAPPLLRVSAAQGSGIDELRDFLLSTLQQGRPDDERKSG